MQEVIVQIGQDLKNRVAETLEPFKIPSDVSSRICEAYSEAWRTYHNASHILQMLQLSDNVRDNGIRTRLKVLVLYHDVWYKVGQPAGKNEQMSAAWAVDDFTLNPDTAYLSEFLRQGIEATATHSLDAVNAEYKEEVSLLLDLDLWGLGQSYDQFTKDTETIWHEFQPIATREQYDSGRARWAYTFLKRPSIYHAEEYKHLESKARENLTLLAI